MEPPNHTGRSQEDVGCERDQFCRVSVNIAGSGPAGIYPQVAALAPSQLAERLCERREPGLSLGIVRGDIRETTWSAPGGHESSAGQIASHVFQW
jgi:hypothetical protein